MTTKPISKIWAILEPIALLVVVGLALPSVVQALGVEIPSVEDRLKTLAIVLHQDCIRLFRRNFA